MVNYRIRDIARAFAKDDGSLKLPVAISWKRHQNRKKIMDAAELISDAEREIGKRYSDEKHSFEDEEGRRKVRPEYFGEYSREIEGLMMQETDVDIKKIELSDLGDLELTDAQMETLAFMIQEV